MESNEKRGWQFSLRALILVTSGCCLLAVGWRWLGMGTLLIAGSVPLAAAPLALLRSSWKQAYLSALGAVYGPFVLMATYTLLWVSCTHCKLAALNLLPIGPGIVLAELGRSALGISNLLGLGGTILAILLSATSVILGAALIRSNRRLIRACILLGMVTACSLGAMGLLAAIRA